MLYCTEVYVSKTKLHFSTKSCHYREKVKTTIEKVHVFHYIFDCFSEIIFEIFAAQIFTKVLSKQNGNNKHKNLRNDLCLSSQQIFCLQKLLFCW